jgi:hypothetical protein
MGDGSRLRMLPPKRECQPLRPGTHGSWRSFDSAHDSPLRSG